MLAAVSAAAVSCNWSQVIDDVKPMPPEIILDNSSAVYSVGVGEELMVSDRKSVV